MSEAIFPAGFEDLEPWASWAQPEMAERSLCRINATMDDIDEFYNAVLPRLDAMLEHLSVTKLDGIDPQSAALMNLALAIAEVAPAVEQFFEPTISYGFDVTRYEQGHISA